MLRPMFSGVDIVKHLTEPPNFRNQMGPEEEPTGPLQQQRGREKGAKERERGGDGTGEGRRV
jgi:hypothetical protein